MGQVWGWGYGGEGQLGLGARIKMVSTPHLIPCIDQPGALKDKALGTTHQGGTNLSAEALMLPGTYVKKIACGGRHSAVITGQNLIRDIQNPSDAIHCIYPHLLTIVCYRFWCATYIWMGTVWTG